jgi:hypothetical protein
MSSALPTVFTPDNIRGVQANLRQGVLQTDSAVQACATLSPDAKANWKTFHDTCLAYSSVPITSFGRALTADIVGGLPGAALSVFTHDSGTFGNSTGEFYNTGRAYERTLVKWQQQITAAGCKIDAPPYDPAADPEDSDLMKLAKWGLIGIVSVAAAYGVSQVAPIVLEGVRAVRATRTQGRKSK